MTAKEIIETVISEMVCANDCAMYHKSHYLMDNCTCYKKEIIKALTEIRTRTTPICAHCGRTWEKQEGMYQDISDELAKEIRDHVNSCEQNPLKQQNRRLAEALARTNQYLRVRTKPLTPYTQERRVDVLMTENEAILSDYHRGKT